MTRRLGSVRAPELTGRGWLNTDRDLSISDLRGRFVLLDFWTFCCINCLHVLDELRPVEQKWADELVVIGVHSPKFVHEADPVALAAAVERYSVHHPVLDDPELTTWSAYTARAWPTLVLIDPEGYVVAHYAGEGHAHAIDALITELAPQHREKGTLQPGDSPYVPPTVEPSDLRFPASVIWFERDQIVVADAGHDEVVVLGDDGQVRQRIGGFSEPNGVCAVPEHLRTELGYDLVVADTVGHRIAGVTLATGEVRTLAGDGQQWMAGDGTSRLSSPWDVVFWHDLVWIAMAGIHQLWTFDPRTGELVAYGTTNEGLLDGPLADAWFAQPSRLVVDEVRDRLWIADSETSAVRYVHDVEGTLHVTTEVGTGLFDFGLRDGPVDQALFQHPLGVAVLADGSIAVADTYNGAVRRIHDGEVTTIATGLSEPSGLLAHPAVPDTLWVVESIAHQVTALPLGGVVEVEGFAHRTQRPVTEVGSDLELVIDFTPPPGQKVDDRFGPPTQLLVTSTPDALIREGAGRGTDLARRIVLDPAVGEGVLHVAARAGSCDIEAGEGAACHMHQQDWGVPVRVVSGADAALRLPLGGTA